LDATTRSIFRDLAKERLPRDGCCEDPALVFIPDPQNCVQAVNYLITPIAQAPPAPRGLPGWLNNVPGAPMTSTTFFQDCMTYLGTGAGIGGTTGIFVGLDGLQSAQIISFAHLINAEQVFSSYGGSVPIVKGYDVTTKKFSPLNLIQSMESP
jgi:hypothetical protein